MGLGVNEIYRNGANLYLEARHFSGGLRDSIYITSNEGTTWTNITANLSANDLNASGITEFGGFVFIAYNLSSPNLGIYRNTMAVGVNENYLSDLIGVFPNPCNDKIVVSNSSDEKIKQISIYDNQGKLVLSVGRNESSLNTSRLNNGLYFMEIMFSDNSTVRRKLLKESTNR